MKQFAHIKVSLFLLGLLFLLHNYPVHAQIIINEVCSYNGSVLEDEDGDISDWFEIYNSGTTSVILTGYSIADESEKKWFFPNILLPQGFFIKVFASGKDRKSGELHTSFKISQEGDKLSLFDPSGNISDELLFDHLQLNHSAGRYPDGNTSSLVIFDIPTPDMTNNSSTPYSWYADNPIFSIEGGFYQGVISLSISVNNSSTIIHYTTDGSIPSDTSAIYTAPIQMSNTTLIRARSFSGNSSILPSETFTNTYIINYLPKLPVISISTNPENLWDWNTGIYVLGPNADSVYPYYGANYWQDWEIPAHIEFFETDKTLAFEQDAGLSIQGGSVSRTRPQQSFRITARNKYGKANIEHRIFEEKTIDKFKIIVLRNSSGDFNKTHFRDGSLHKLMLNNVDIDLLCYRPSVIYLNGAYWGILNIREKFSKYYLQENYNVDPDNIDLLEEDSTVIQGDTMAFHTMHAFITTNDMQLAANYDSANSMIDIKSFCDYVIAETFLSNIDWPYNNIKYWKLREAGSKWRYLLMDLDISLGNNGWAPANLDFLGKILGPYGYNNKHAQLLKSLLKNTNFRNYFINRYADLVNTLFTSENMKNHIEKIMAVLQDDIPLHFEKWGNSIGGWYYEINTTVFPYIEDRPAYALQNIQDTFNLKKQVDIRLDAWPPEAGYIKINTIQPSPLPWNGTYFDGVPVIITAIPNTGYIFKQWRSENINLSDSYNPILNLNVDTNNLFTAYFISTENPKAFTVFPNPVKNILNIGVLLESNRQGSISLYNAFGKQVKTFEVTFQSGSNFKSIDISDLNNGFYILDLKTSESEKTAKVIIIH